MIIKLKHLIHFFNAKVYPDRIFHFRIKIFSFQFQTYNTFFDYCNAFLSIFMYKNGSKTIFQ